MPIRASASPRSSSTSLICRAQAAAFPGESASVTRACQNIEGRTSGQKARCRNSAPPYSKMTGSPSTGTTT